MDFDEVYKLMKIWLKFTKYCLINLTHNCESDSSITFPPEGMELSVNEMKELTKLKDIILNTDF